MTDSATLRGVLAGGVQHTVAKAVVQVDGHGTRWEMQMGDGEGGEPLSLLKTGWLFLIRAAANGPNWAWFMRSGWPLRRSLLRGIAGAVAVSVAVHRLSCCVRKAI
eukprot:352983-Chlamydomonas_euryale.AAC.11